MKEEVDVDFEISIVFPLSSSPLSFRVLWPLALRGFLWANPRRNDTSDPIAPENWAQENGHLIAF